MDEICHFKLSHTIGKGLAAPAGPIESKGLCNGPIGNEGLYVMGQ